MKAVDRILTIDNSVINDTSIQNENLINIFPSSGSSLNQNGEISFVIKTCDQYNTYTSVKVYLKTKLSKLDKINLATTDEVSLINNSSIFLVDRATYGWDASQKYYRSRKSKFNKRSFNLFIKYE